MSPRCSICWRSFVAAVLLSGPASLACGLEFPYTAYVCTTDVYVRSGPGRDYYPTAKLNKGEAVEVYRHDPGGWLAIRPPRGSFSWVSSRHLDVQEDNLAVVNSQRVVARVGSAFSDVRDVIQVRLDKDEPVELLEPPTPEVPWCRIAPPPGEFRWIFAKYIERELPEDLAEDQREAGPQMREDANVRLTGGDDEADSPDKQNARAEFAGDLSRLRELEHVDIELSAIVAKDVSQWSFDELHQRVESAINAAQDPLERGRARVLLDKLARFDDIKRRHEALRDTRLENPDRRAADAGVRSRPDPRFDATGRLSPVVSQRTGGPQYALIDSSGAVLSFVTPAPGINLRPFVDKQIGVNGQRGYLSDLARQHISVQRVTLLDTQLR
ncbi:MAG: SH3 domain-containing protein [Pirellulales bacterium]